MGMKVCTCMSEVTVVTAEEVWAEMGRAVSQELRPRCFPLAIFCTELRAV